MRLTEQELSSINGGAVKTAFGIIIAGALIFTMGVINGWKRPLTCGSGK
ncbi:MAG: class IIb bacteriocin, lactobin A/cerein 7B family [Candidatus Coprovivens sp.]